MKIIGEKIINLQSVSSTNDYAKDILLNQNVEEGIVINTYYQKKGRGHINNIWESKKDENLIFSFILFPEFLQIEKQFLLSKFVSLAIVDFLKSYTKKVKIKWPNDIYINDKKICGILIENSIIEDKISNSVIGIGLNINQTEFNKNIPNPTSLKLITGKNYKIETCLNELINFLNIRYQQLTKGKFDIINENYINNLYKFSVIHIFKKGNKKFKAKIVGISETGQLIIEDKNGFQSLYSFKEISF